jgi:serine/threonine protein kinase
MTTWPEPGSAGDRIPLRELIDRYGALPPEAALLVFRESLLELASAHEHGSTHRDFGPESVLVGHDGGCELSDFDALGRPGTGLAPYQAPEQQNGAWPSRAGNLYTATAVFFECLTGLAPSPEDIRRFRQRQLTVSARIGQATEPLCGLMAWGMAASPANRPVSAADLVTDLDDTASAVYGPDWRRRGRRELAECVAGMLPGAPRTADGRLPASWLRRQGRAAYAGVAAAAVLAVLGVTGTAFALTGHFGSKPPHLASSVGSGSASASSSAAAGSNSAPPTGRATFAAAAGVTPHATPTCADSTSCSHPTPTTAASPAASASRAGSTTPGTTPSTLASPPDITVQFFTDQAQPKTVACGSTPPTFQVWAKFTLNEAIPPETYHWIWPDGTVSAPKVLTLGSEGGDPVFYFTPASDTFSGNATLVFTSPVKESWSFPLSMNCTVSGPPTAPATPVIIHVTPQDADGNIPGLLRQPFSATFTYADGASSHTWEAVNLPPGLTINASTGVVSGIPTSVGAYKTMITVRTADGTAVLETVTFTFSLTIP